MPEQGRPQTGTYLGIDYGRKAIGVAVGQTLTGTARPLETLKAERVSHLWLSLERLVRDFEPDGFVVGIPVPMETSQEHNPLIDEIHEFNHQLYATFGLPIHTMDETLSTRASQSRYYEERTRRSGDFRRVKDQMAAALILESWLAQPKHREVPGE